MHINDLWVPCYRAELFFPPFFSLPPAAAWRAVVHNRSYKGCNSLVHVGIELATSVLGAQRSNHLNHWAGLELNS